MSAAPEALVLDDGELDDVVELLAELGFAPERLRGGNVPEVSVAPARLFVATARRALAARCGPAAGGGPVRIAVVEEDSNTLRAALRRVGFDYLVRRPVHPYALRLLLLRALYAGSERRRETRVPVGYAASYRTGLRRRDAVLVELSLRGGRLLVERPLPAGARIRLQLPSEVTGERPLGLRAKVLRCEPGGPEVAPGLHAVALRFESLPRGTRRRLAAVLARRAEGPATLPVLEDPAAGAAPCHDSEERRNGKGASATTDDPQPEPEVPAAGTGTPVDRRKHRRGAYRSPVHTGLAGAERVLVGRDLSVGGMRVDAPDLEPGARLRVALYPAAREEPVVIDARVVRSDAASGTGLRFESVPPGEAARLEALVARLPAVEPLAGGEAEALGSVVSEILERG